jgi:hypothetical protein
VLWRNEARARGQADSALAELRLSFAREIRAMRAAGGLAAHAAGERDAYAAIFDDSRWEVPWRAGRWYIIRLTSADGHLSITQRVTLDSYGTESYYVKDGTVWSIDRSGGAAATPAACSAGGLRVTHSGVSCNEAVSFYYQFAAGTIDASWGCSGDATAGRCVIYGIDNLPSRSFGWG